jgi:hypothetical protein
MAGSGEDVPPALDHFVTTRPAAETPIVTSRRYGALPVTTTGLMLTEVSSGNLLSPTQTVEIKARA